MARGGSRRVGVGALLVGGLGVPQPKGDHNVDELVELLPLLGREQVQGDGLDGRCEHLGGGGRGEGGGRGGQQGG